MAGIEAEVLELRNMSISNLKEFKRLLKSLTPSGGFVLCSCSGLYSVDFLERIQELYRIADELKTIMG
jgi:hypothetical protein